MRSAFLRILALATVYVLAARIGLALDAVSGFATLVWPPSGIALAALLLLGFRMWPGVFVGAVAVNLLAGAGIPIAIGIGAGNTAAALAATYALQRVPGFATGLSSDRNVVALILAATVSPVISATIGVASLHAGGLVPDGAAFDTWRAWWVGDVLGDLVIAPLILVWVTGPRRLLRGARLLEATSLVLATLVVGFITFLGSQPTPDSFAPYLLYPVLIWAAFRFGPRGATATVLLASAGAVLGTATNRGPFVRAELHDSLLALQLFMGTVTVTFLVLAGTVEERRAAEARAVQSRGDAERANRAKADFLAVMSHELRTPLNAIAGFVDLLDMGAQGPLTDKQRDSLMRIKRNQDHLLALINDLLAFARTEAGRLVLKPVALRVADALADVEPFVQQELRRKQLVFQQSSVDNSLVVCADPERLRQIIVNLLSNAIKYTEPGGRVALGAAESTGRVSIWVEDSGIGIPPGDLPHIFEPFYQVERGSTRRFSGAGLGLTIARDLARAMGGDVNLESKPGEGTRVTVSLPAA